MARKKITVEVVGSDYSDLRDHVNNDVLVRSLISCVICADEHEESSEATQTNLQNLIRLGWRVANITDTGIEGASEGPVCPRCLKKYGDK
jgi:hypothetical protein